MSSENISRLESSSSTPFRLGLSGRLGVRKSQAGCILGFATFLIMSLFYAHSDLGLYRLDGRVRLSD